MKQTAFSVRSIRIFAREHDDLPAFHAAFLVLTFLAAAMLNLGFFALLIALHMVLDVVKYRDVHRLNWFKTAEGVLRESIVDVTLLSFGLVVSVYLHPSLTGLIGIKGLMLAELTVVRGVGVVAPKLKILYDSLKILYHLEVYLDRIHPRLGEKLSPVDYACAFSLTVTIGLLIIAPLALGLSTQEYFLILLEEGIPWKL